MNFSKQFLYEVRRGSYVAVDVETTGLTARRGGRIIEIGAVVVEDGGLAAEFQGLINPGIVVPPQARRVHGITDAMLCNQPPPEYVLPRFLEFIGTCTLIAHNAAFDLSFLRSEFRRLGLNLANQHICTLKMSRRHLPDLPNHKLATVYRHLLGNPPAGQQHRALTDAKMAALIWLELMK